ncbi:transporter [Fulvitalea axinellae]|uniref:Transporter n=1 Tax=Fulvitalea axinellae TaxID=1182444 RepID=A0AAU9CGF8_9BACT|nr:transporter [Fulvitalea axinellae]
MSVGVPAPHIVTLTIIAVVYLGMILGKFGDLKIDRSAIVLIGMIALLVAGSISLPKAIQSVDFPSMLILFGLMTISSQLHLAGFYRLLASKVAEKTASPRVFLALLMFSSGLLSALINNDVVCLVFTPVITKALLKAGYRPAPFLIGMALASNIGCSLTLIGNAQSVVIGQVANLNFGGYTAWSAVPSLLSLAVAFFVVCGLSRKDLVAENNAEAGLAEERTIAINPLLVRKGVLVLVLLIATYFTDIPRYLSTLVAAGIILINSSIKSRKILNRVDWQLLILFSGLFVLMGALNETGLPKDIYSWLNSKGINPESKSVTALLTGFAGNLMNNAAGFILILQIVEIKEAMTGYVIAIANAFGGNLLLTSSVANLIVANAAAKYDVRISFKEFMRYGIPVSVLSFVILLAWIRLMEGGSLVP